MDLKEIAQKIARSIQGGSDWGTVGKTPMVVDFIEEKVDDGDLVLISNTQVKLCSKQEALDFCDENEGGWTSVVTDEVIKDVGGALIGVILT